MPHTPGPWKWLDYPDGRKLLTAPSRAVIHCPDAPIGIELSDQHILAASPDLLEALKGVQRHMTHSAMCSRTIERGDWQCSCGFNAAYDAASVAIAKAEGR